MCSVVDFTMLGTISWKSGFCHRSKANITIYRKENEDINTLCVVTRYTTFITQWLLLLSLGFLCLFCFGPFSAPTGQNLASFLHQLGLKKKKTRDTEKPWGGTSNTYTHIPTKSSPEEQHLPTSHLLIVSCFTILSLAKNIRGTLLDQHHFPLQPARNV